MILIAQEWLSWLVGEDEILDSRYVYSDRVSRTQNLVFVKMAEIMERVLYSIRCDDFVTLYLWA